MAGRPRKPSHLKVVAGTDRPDRTNRKEPKPRRERPSPPAHLSDRAKVAWGALSVLIDRMGVLTEADGIALEMGCEAYADYLGARADLAAFGSNYYQTVSESGSIMYRLHPAFAVMQDADRRVASWLAKFGLTPADRSRVSAAFPDAVNDFADLG